MKAAARVIYRGSWETERPAIMKKYGWETSNSEVLISTPRRFGKTFSCARCPRHAHARTLTTRARFGSIAIFCACLALSFGLEIVVFSECSLLNLCSQQSVSYTHLTLPTIE